MNNKIRLDQLVVSRGFAESREKAKRMIMAGLIYSEGQVLDKPGVKVAADINMEIKGKKLPYVGRGGLKLEKAIKHFSLDLQDKIMIDVGSSTGGFTDCALQNGVRLSYAVDVGYNQLAWKLRNDPRVIVMERTNFRYVTPDQLTDEMPNFATVDVSFISLRLILPPLFKLLENNSKVVILIKPQFEAGKEQVGKKGIVRDKEIHEEVVYQVLTFAHKLGFWIKGVTYSPITGGDGNIEFLCLLEKQPAANMDASQLGIMITEVVQSAHQEFMR